MDGRWSVGRWSLIIGRWSMVNGHSHGHGHGQKCLESLSVHSLCQNSKVAVSHPLTKVRYRAARAAKNTYEDQRVVTVYESSNKQRWC